MEETKNTTEEMFDLIPTDTIDSVTAEPESDEDGLSTPLAMLIGAGIALGVSAVSKTAIKWYRKRKAAKACRESSDEPVDVDEEDIITVDEE